MKKVNQILSVLFFIAFCFPQNANAQYVNIPDTYFGDLLYGQTDPNCWAQTIGYDLDTTCADLNLIFEIDEPTSLITDLTGIEYLKNLKKLWISESSITFLPKLPSKLETIWADNCAISSLVNLPDSIKDLDLWNNALTSLPSLPNGIETLNIQGNYFTSNPIYPSSLRELNIAWNLIPDFPIVSTQLKSLSISFTLIDTILPLPDSLSLLTCQDLNVYTLPVLPHELLGLYCDSNNISVLPTLPSKLQRLSASKNKLTFIPNFPDSLWMINCPNNLLTSLPSMGNRVKYFNCSYNQLTSLPLLSDSLNSYICSHNALTSLPPFPTAILNLFDASFNQLTTVPAFNNNYASFYLQNNLLTSLPVLPTNIGALNISNNPTLMCLPALKKINTLNFTNTGITCLPNYGTVTTSTPALSSLPLCGIFNNSGCNVYWNISGKDYLDFNSNCNIESSDLSLSNLKMQLFSGGNLKQQVYTGGEGLYSFDTDSLGLYTTKVDTTNIPFTILCPVSKTYQENVTVADSMKYDRNFSMKCKEGNDAVVWSINGGTFKPGNDVMIKISAGDFASFFAGDCGTPFGGELQVVLTGDITYIGPALGALTPTYQNGDTIRYTIPDFKAIDHSTAFRFIARTDTNALIGSIINVQASIAADSVEYNFNNNFKSQNFVVVSSFDPNDKSASPTSTLDVNGDKWLTYKIRFQNTGTAVADNIYILDTISSQLDISTFTLLSYSHPALVQIFNNRVAKFNFPNINLPDSTSNELASHGYIEYKIKANDTIAVNNTISNTAYIYFDFNSPVITNTTINTAINCHIPPTIIQDTVCLGDSYYLNGVRYLTEGIYQQHHLTKFGCDSIVELRLTTNKATITRNLSSLIADQNNGQYQWIYCSTGAIIPGANSQIYQPGQSGNYAVIVNFGGCTDTSDCYYYSPLGINDLLSAQIIIYPNPFKSELKINLGQIHTGSIEVFSLIGELVLSQQIQSGTAMLNTQEWPSGMYLLKVKSPDGIFVKRVVKQ